VLVIPAIDLKDGRCVRLRQGDMAAETIYSDDVMEVAGRWQEKGASLIHVVDLNGAVDGEPKNLPHIESILKAVRVKVQVGGGIRTTETVRRYFNAGVSFLAPPHSPIERFWNRLAGNFRGASFWGSMREKAESR
jgi:phosphoribosylformimino-5-aminoimidazole carboxamide ribotide isomerase